jgi:hypothetical protein
VILHARRFHAVRFGEDLWAPFMAHLLPHAEVLDGREPDAAGARAWDAPELEA